jgi:hypothetical protein
MARYGHLIRPHQSTHFFAHTISAAIVLFVEGCMSLKNRASIINELRAVLALLRRTEGLPIQGIGLALVENLVEVSNPVPHFR